MEYPKIYVACLAAYNEGKLHGRWIEIDIDPDVMQDEINDVIKSSPAFMPGEYAIHDYDGLDSSLGEWPSLDDLATIAGLLDDGHNIDIINALLSNHGGYVDDMVKALENGHLDSKLEHVWHYFDLESIPDNLTYYLDTDRMFDAIGHDMTVLKIDYDSYFVYSC